MWWTLPSSLCQDWGPHSPSWPGYRWIMNRSYIPSRNFLWPKGAALPRKPWKLGKKWLSGESGRQRRQCWEFLLDLATQRSLVTLAPEVWGRARYGLQWHEEAWGGMWHAVAWGNEEELELGPEGKVDWGMGVPATKRGWCKWRDPCWRRHLVWLEGEVRRVVGKADGAGVWLS